MQRDFVIQLRPEADPSRGLFAGRLEHVDSGRSAHFSSMEEVLALLARLLPGPSQPQSRHPDPR